MKWRYFIPLLIVWCILVAFCSAHAQGTDPLSVTSATLKFHYRADSSVTLFGSDVTLWGDRTGTQDFDDTGGPTTAPELISACSPTGLDCIRFDGVDEFLSHDTAGPFTEMQFMHDGTGGTIVSVVRIVPANPDALYGLFDNTNASSGTGIIIEYDDRSASSANDRFIAVIKFSSGTNTAAIVSTNNLFSTQVVHVLIVSYKNNALADDFDIWVDGVSVASSGTDNTPNNTAAIDEMHLGNVSNGTFHANIDQFSIYIYDGEMSDADKVGVSTFLQCVWEGTCVSASVAAGLIRRRGKARVVRY